ncbi:MAG: heme-degrading domain-containing protein [Lachnospiraceae bacterium]|jgi:uncharacterized protein (UPF0303 family)
MTIDEVMTILVMQEEILQFNHFTNEDAWELGNIIVQEAKRRGYQPAVSIRLNNGYTVFQYAANGTNLRSEELLRRKCNTVKVTEKSSLRLYSELQQADKTMADILLDEKEYACAGGGFPIRVEEVGVIGAIAVANQNHFSDHDLIVKAVSRYLHVDEVPRIRSL